MAPLPRPTHSSSTRPGWGDHPPGPDPSMGGPNGGSGAYAILALPDLCLGIVSGRLETTQVSLGVLLCYATRSPGMPGAFFVSLLIDALLARTDGSQEGKGP